MENAPKDPKGALPARLADAIDEANEALFDRCAPRADAKAVLVIGGEDVLTALAWRWDPRPGSAGSAGTARGQGLPRRDARRVSLSEVTLNHAIDKDSHRLLELCCTGRHIPGQPIGPGVLRLERGSDVLEFKLNDLIVSAVAPATPAAPDVAPTSITLNFSAIELTYGALGEDGEPLEPRGRARTDGEEQPAGFTTPAPSQEEREEMRRRVERSLHAPGGGEAPGPGGAGFPPQPYPAPGDMIPNPPGPYMGRGAPPMGAGSPATAPTSSWTAPTTSTPGGKARRGGGSSSPPTSSPGATTPGSTTTPHPSMPTEGASAPQG